MAAERGWLVGWPGKRARRCVDASGGVHVRAGP